MLGVDHKTNGIHIYNQYIDFYFDYNDKGPTGEGIKIYPPNTPYPSTNGWLDFTDPIDQQIFINDFTNFMIYFQENVYTTHQIMKLECMVFTNRNVSHMWGNNNEIFFFWDALYGGMGAPMYEDANGDKTYTTLGENPELAHQVIAHEYGHHETVPTMSSAAALTGAYWKNTYPFEKFEEYWQVSKWDQIPEMVDYLEFVKNKTINLGNYTHSSTPDMFNRSDYDDSIGFPDMSIPSWDNSKHRTFTHEYTTNPQDFSYLMSYHERMARDLAVLQVDIDFSTYPTWDMIIQHWDIQMIKEFFPNNTWLQNDQQGLDAYYNTMLKYAYADSELGTFGNETLDVALDGSYDIKERTINGTTDINNEFSYLVFENDDEIFKSEIKYYQPIYYLDANRDREELGYKWTATLPLDEIGYDGDTYDVYFEDASGNKIETFTVATYPSDQVVELRITTDKGGWNENKQIVFENKKGNIEATFKM